MNVSGTMFAVFSCGLVGLNLMWTMKRRRQQARIERRCSTVLSQALRVSAGRRTSRQDSWMA
jgi:hypothetical protein